MRVPRFDVSNIKAARLIRPFLLTVIFISFQTQADTANQHIAGNFSVFSPGSPVPSDWQSVTFAKIPRHTRYRLVYDKTGETGATVIEALSEHSASGLFKKLELSPDEYPVLQWRWKISNTLKISNAYTKNGDDYAARLYITFAGNDADVSLLERLRRKTAQLFYENTPANTLSYIWSHHEMPGTIIHNAYTDRNRMIVLQNSEGPENTWISEQRNIHDDYIKAFGEKPSRITGIAIMTDTDNTGSRATAWYGDISFLPLAGAIQPLN